MVKHPFIVSFSGIDGAGKSTQISRLQEALERDGCRTAIVTFWDDVVALKRFREDAGHQIFKGDRGIGAPEAPIVRRDKNVQSPILTVIRMGLYFLDCLSLKVTVRHLNQSGATRGADVIIFDRYLYDELANVKANNFATRFYLRWMLRLMPTPDVAFVLDADPDAAFARKPEYPLAFLHSNRRAYLDLAARAGMKVIRPAAIEQAHDEVLSMTVQTRDALLLKEE